ncbi:MAG: carbohydrate-binding module family 20 domain-containing protein, partial [bacterium]
MIRKVILLAFLFIPHASYAQGDSTENKITFRVISSKLIPYAAKIHITGDHPQLRNWQIPGIPLEERSAGVWEKTFPFATGTQLQYIFDLGSFESVGLDSSGNFIGDSLFHAGAINQHSHSFLEVMNDTTITVRIPQWRQGEVHLFADNLDTTSVWLGVQWRYHSGDKEEWANPEFDDSSWELVRSVLGPDELPKNGWPGVGWFRLHIV